MRNVFTDYPDVPWKQGWRLSSGPEDKTLFVTAASSGELTAPDNGWMLRLIAPAMPHTLRLLSNGISISARRHPEKKRIEALVIHPGILSGTVFGLPAPQLNAATEIHSEPGITWTQSGSALMLLLLKENRFVLVHGKYTPEQAAAKASDALEQPFDELTQQETEKRQHVSTLFSINTRHNPPVALAAENLRGRLREQTGPLHGLWSAAEGFDAETFSLNELYPLIRAWGLIDPAIAMELAQTALSLQQGDGGFPSWVQSGGIRSPAAPWPLIAQSFELAWQSNRDPAVLKQHLPALRKYAQWAVRHFDPRRDRISSWQSEQEVFIPGSFDRDKATPDLTVLLLAELEAILRLCRENEQYQLAIESLTEERDQLIKTLNTIFWNPETKAFSNAWKNGHYLHEPSFGSFMPLFWNGLDPDKRTTLLESFEEMRGFPGHLRPASWKQEETDETAGLPAIHQFMALEALRNATDSLRSPYVHRAREQFAVWFNREHLASSQEEGRAPARSAYAMGPVTAAFILTVQEESEQEAVRAPSATRRILNLGRRLKIRKTDLRIISVVLLAMLLAHLLYNLPRRHDIEARIADAALYYQQGRYTEAMQICRRYPHTARSLLLQANMLMLAEQPDQAEKLYRQALSKETESASALFGLALALQLNSEFKQAEKRYIDFIDLYESRWPEAASLADEFILLTREQFKSPPRWKRVFALPMMKDLRL